MDSAAECCTRKLDEFRDKVLPRIRKSDHGGPVAARMLPDLSRYVLPARATQEQVNATLANLSAADLLPKIMKESKRIIFNGNNYAQEWENEAGKRGLLNLKNTLDALPLPRGGAEDCPYYFWNGITTKRAVVGIALATLIG